MCKCVLTLWLFGRRAIQPHVPDIPGDPPQLLQLLAALPALPREAPLLQVRARSTGGPGQRGTGPALGPVLMKAVMPYGLLTRSRPRSCVLSRWDHLNGSLTCQGQERAYEWGCESWNSSSTGCQLQHLGRPNSHPGSDSSPLSFVLQPSEFWPAVL